jgi:hypothetical protein
MDVAENGGYDTVLQQTKQALGFIKRRDAADSATL